ncbi:hypothetical protein RJN96_000125 [Enterobacter hormaechei]|uniref:hypothetical protein n=1 Tax=Enterobacter hormaechei TaxID=158836 RepID=UPI000F83AFCF|nr:hypothetical protein [Enterobacter hormaechei]EMD6793563.1 hypothetical protein [Enterobacter hormaechei subsp. steigerwaltii]EKZ9447102.1 hypothetical protein [Enterobacter hormaechei]EKZ9451652.1 hypothetical protein [Enterobacter hormaechei]ELC6289041.1 hypothetical protein [Enterobacter hormaechei]ELJ2228998.1 hypothetical protein [Enterobacter hormaechei]
MSYFGLNTVNQNQQLDQAASNPAGTKSDVGFFDGAMGATASGLYSGLVAKPDQLLWAGVDTVVSPVARFVTENTGVKDSSPEFIAQQRKLAAEQVKRLTPDPATTGTAGQVLYGLFDMGSQAVVSTLAAGPVGAAATVTSLQGFSEFERLRGEGVDYSTAQDVALVHGLTAGAGTVIPMSIGLRAGGVLAEGVGAQLSRSAVGNVAGTVARAAPDIAYAAGTNVAFGMAMRGSTAAILRDNGYEEMAAQYDVFDKQALAIDAVLGLAFGGIGRFVNSRGENVRPPDFMPSDVDAALAANAAHHAEFDIAPGVPINVLSRDAHAQAVQQAMRDVSAGRPVDVASIVEPAAFSDVPGRRSLIAQSIDEVLYQADEGSAARAVETRVLEEQAAQILPRGDRQVYQSEIANSQRIVDNLTEQRNQILSEEPKGSGKALAQARADKQARLRDLDQRIAEAQGRLEFSRNALAPHEPGGEFFEARAELARRQQAESDLNAQALSFYRTAEVRTANEAAPIDQNAPLRDVERTTPGRKTEGQQDIDVMAAEESLMSSPDMMITVLDEEGNPQSRSAREVLDEAARENEQAIQDSSLFDVAVACFLRG